MKTLFSAIGLIVIGFLYYGLFRFTGGQWNDLTQGSFPSFIFVLAFSLASSVLLGGSRLNQLRLSAGWLALTLAVEPLFGFFDPQDMVAAVLGFAVAAFIIWRRGAAASVSRTGGRWAAVVAVLLLAGSYLPGECINCGGLADKTPRYLSYSELRSSIVVESPRTMAAMGNLYLYADRLFINEQNKGIHVLDNSDPANPVAESFIKIPGNTNISIRSGYLYADSFVDLVVLDIRDSANIQEVNRQVDVFPYDAYQTIKDDSIYLGFVDKDRGVVIGYE